MYDIAIGILISRIVDHNNEWGHTQLLISPFSNLTEDDGEVYVDTGVIKFHNALWY